MREWWQKHDWLDRFLVGLIISMMVIAGVLILTFFLKYVAVDTYCLLRYGGASTLDLRDMPYLCQKTFREW